jgi:hypothetical protein
VVLRAATSTDVNYNGLKPDDVPVINKDNEEPAYPSITIDSATARIVSSSAYMVEYEITVTGTAAGPVGTLFNFNGDLPPDFVMSNWTGTDGLGVRGVGYPYRARGDDPTTTFTYTERTSFFRPTPATTYVVCNLYPPDSVGDFEQGYKVVVLPA